MAGELNIFSDTAIALSRNPLGIIALFIVFIYFFASIPATFSKSFTMSERRQLVHFLTLFPVLVLAVFVYLVVNHSVSLYGPGDFKNEKHYVDLVVARIKLAADSKKVILNNVDRRDVGYLVSSVDEYLNQNRDRPWRGSILWVDDNPENNEYERKSFEAAGISVVVVLSSEAAIAITSHNKFAAIISDMGRKEGEQAGYSLLKELRGKCNLTPFFIYASKSNPEFRCETLKLGGQGNTNNPQELFEMVIKTIIGNGGSGASLGIARSALD